MSRRSVLAATGTLLGAGSVASLSEPAAAQTIVPVNLGENVTFTDFDREATAARSKGTMLAEGRANVDLSQNRLQADVRAITGVGEAIRQAYMGRRIQVMGDESQIAHISIDGRIAGRLRSFGDTSASVRARILVVNHSDDNSRRTTTVFSRTAAGIGERNVDHRVGGSMSVELQPGDTYQLWAVLAARIDSNTSQVGVLPRSNFFDSGGGMFVDRMRITF